MRTRPNPAKRRGQGGFTMVELLLTAFILAVGIMGLSMLQVMSLKASRGGRSLSTAVLVADKVMDQIEMEGRLTWINITASNYSPPTPIPTANLRYVDKAVAVSDVFTIKGLAPDTLKPAGDPDRDTFFTVTTTRGNPVASTSGAMHDYNVTVTFSDNVVSATNVPITRTVTLTRRILHG